MAHLYTPSAKEILRDIRGRITRLDWLARAWEVLIAQEYPPRRAQNQIRKHRTTCRTWLGISLYDDPTTPAGRRFQEVSETVTNLLKDKWDLPGSDPRFPESARQAIAIYESAIPEFERLIEEEAHEAKLEQVRLERARKLEAHSALRAAQEERRALDAELGLTADESMDMTLAYILAELREIRAMLSERRIN